MTVLISAVNIVPYPATNTSIDFFWLRNTSISIGLPSLADVLWYSFADTVAPVDGDEIDADSILFAGSAGRGMVGWQAIATDCSGESLS